jgi:hypothetical protein
MARALLRDGQIARLETGLAPLAGLHLLRVRDLLDGMNKRGLAALCGMQASGAPHDIAIRMGLAEQETTASTRRARTPPRHRRRSALVRSDQERPGADVDLVPELSGVPGGSPGF